MPTEARLVEIVFPNDTNPYGTMFGGAAYAMMDRAAFLAANQHARCNAVTAASERVDFSVPIHQGEIVEAVARVVHTGRSSLIVRVDLNARSPLEQDWRRCTSGYFTMVAVDERGAPLPVPPLTPTTPDELAEWAVGERIRAAVKARAGAPPDPTAPGR